ncbi:MAG: hypothetical protein MUF54_16525, partial [Polyangiaceae bacterium]|nr:hypothetical protein [Polyangiaceae bacterium]
MTDATRKQNLDVARSLEKRGHVDAAVAAYVRAGAAEEASQALISVRRFGEAADLLLKLLGTSASRSAELDPDGRRLAYKAGICLSHAKRTREAVEMFLSLGDVKRAADVLEQAGDSVGAAGLRASRGRHADFAAQKPQPVRPNVPTLERARELERAGRLELALETYLDLRKLGHAGRVLRKLGRLAEAARLFLQIDLPYEAGVCLAEARQAEAALEQLKRVPMSHPHYRAAALRAIHLSAETDLV